MDIKLKFWADGPVLSKTAQVCGETFDRLLTNLAALSARWGDADTCPVPILNLLAYQRGITRLEGEDDNLYRKRVKYAFENSLDAGSAAGFARIWARLGLGVIVQTERYDSTDWDVIKIQLDEATFARYRGLFEALIGLYGRTCRRYQIESADPAHILTFRQFNFDCETDFIMIDADFSDLLPHGAA